MSLERGSGPGELSLLVSPAANEREQERWAAVWPFLFVDLVWLPPRRSEAGAGWGGGPAVQVARQRNSQIVAPNVAPSAAPATATKMLALTAHPRVTASA